MKKLLAMMMTLVMAFSLWTVPVVTAEDSVAPETEFSVNEMFVDYEFNETPGEAPLEGLGNAGRPSPTVATVDNAGVAVFDKSVGQVSFCLSGTNESAAPLRSAMESGEVAFEYRVKFTEGTHLNFAGGLAVLQNGKIKVGGREVAAVTAGEWITLAFVVDYSTNTLTKVKINDTYYVVSNYTLPTLDNVFGSNDLWTYLYPGYCSGDTNVLYMDYFRAYSVSKPETEFTADEMFLDYEFDETPAAVALNGLGNAGRPSPTVATVDNAGVVVFDKSVGQVSFCLSGTNEYATQLRSAMESGNVAFEYRMKFTGGTHMVLAGGLATVHNQGYIQVGEKKVADVTAGDWITLAFVVDYSTNTLKKVKINDTYYIVSGYKLPTLDSLFGSYDLWTYLYPGYCSGDTNILYMDYFRAYSVKENKEENITTAYDVNEWIYDFEFNEFDSIPGNAFNGYALPYIETVDNGSVAVFDGNKGRTGFTLSGTDEAAELKTALASGQVAFEMRFKNVGNTDGNGVWRGYMEPLFTSYYGGKFYFSQYENDYGVLTDDWHTATALLDYSSGTVTVEEVILDGIKKTVKNTTKINTVDDLLATMRIWQYAGTDVKMYLDYFRVYSVIDVPDYIDTAYQVKEMLYGYEFNEEDGLSGMDNRWIAPTLSDIDGEGVAVFEKTADSTSQNIGVSFPRDERATALETALASDEVVFETRIKAEGKAFAKFLTAKGGSTGLISYAGSDDEGGKDWLQVFGRNFYSIPNTERDWIKVSIVMDYTSGTGMIKELKINDEIMNTSALGNYIFSVDDLMNAETNKYFLWSFVYPDYCGDTCKLYMDYLRIYSIDDVSNSSIIRRIDAAKRAELAKVDYYSSDWTLNSDGSFTDLTYEYAEGVDEELVRANRAEHISRVKGMAAAYANETSENYMDASLLANVKTALSYYVNANFDRVGNTGNWSNALENPRILADVFVILKNIGIDVDSDLLATAKTNYFDLCESNDGDGIKNAKIFAYNTSNLPVTCNLWMTLSVLYDTVDNMTYIPKIYTELGKVLNNHVGELGSGVLAEDAESYTGAEKGVSYFGDGFYPDGSYLGHGPLHYTFGYGRQFLSGCAKFVELAAGTEYQPEADKLSVLTDLVLDNMRWLIRGDNSEFTGIGRSVEAYDANGKVSDGMINDLIGYVTKLLAEPNIPRKNELGNFLADLRENSTASQKGSYITGNKHFWSSDLMAHQREGYFAGVKMSSTRTLKTERVGDVGKNTFYLSDGVTPIMVDGNEYEEAISVWDWTRLPGITALHTADVPELTDLSSDANTHYGSDSFVGGASDGTYGVAAMDYRTDLGCDGVVETPVVSAKKAWFFFDDEFVALGTDIESTDAENDLYTNLNQSILDGDVVSSAGVLSSESEMAISGWAYHDNIGYVLPENQTATIANKTQTNGDYSENIFSMYLNHGTNVSNASYSYIVVPGATQADVAAYASDIPVEIVSNTETIQAVYHKELKILQAVFREAGKLTLMNGSEIAVDKPAIVMVKIKDSGYEIAAQNPYNEKAAANFTVNERFDTFVNTYNAETGISTVNITPLNGLYAGKSVGKNLSKVFFTDENGNKVTALSPNATLNINAEKSFLDNATVIYVAIYNADGTLKKVERFTGTFSAEETDIITKPFTAPADATAADTVKVFVWSDNDGIKPVTKAQYMTN